MEWIRCLSYKANDMGFFFAFDSVRHKTARVSGPTC